MKATEAKLKLLEILRDVSQFFIPIYQRTYSWTRKECEQLWGDILNAGSADEFAVHFIGSVVHVDNGLGNIAIQALKQLRLSLNMPFADLDDPKGLAKNVTGLGRWGNGDVEHGVAPWTRFPMPSG